MADILMLQHDRPWANLPSAALLTIFRRTEFRDRFSIPLVCKPWKSISEQQEYWSSMIPDSISPEDAFINQRCPAPTIRHDIKLLYDHLEPKLTYPEQLMRKAALGISRLQTLIKKSGAGDAITSLYLAPFMLHHNIDGYEIISNKDKVFRLITDCCPNLKYISFYRCFQESCVWDPIDVTEDALIELISKCKRLEIIDFDYIRSTHYSASFMQKLATCLPHLRGIRIQSREFVRSCPLAHDIAKYLPRLKLLNLAHTRVNGDELSSILSGCRELQYLNIEGSALYINTYRYNHDIERRIRDQRIRDQCLVYKAVAQIPYFYCASIDDHCPCSICMLLSF